jgi:hypothetical protein
MSLWGTCQDIRHKIWELQELQLQGKELCFADEEHHHRTEKEKEREMDEQEYLSTHE